MRLVISRVTVSVRNTVSVSTRGGSPLEIGIRDVDVRRTESTCCADAALATTSAPATSAKVGILMLPPGQQDSSCGNRETSAERANDDLRHDVCLARSA